MSHLAILARLELLHASTLLRLSGRPERSSDIHESIDHPDSVLPVTEDSDQSTAEEAWDEVASLLKVLGDGLREESLRIPLGKTSLPSTLADLLRFALDSPSTTASDRLPSPVPGCPQGKKSQAIVEICRVAGNLCFDCDENRSILLEYSFPQTLIVLIASIASTIDSNVNLAKSALGALLNISLDHDQTQTAILNMEGALEVLIKAANNCYLPDPVKGNSSADNVELRRAISGWAWRVVGEISLLESASTVLSAQAEALFPHLVLPILTYLPPSSSPVPFKPEDVLILTTATQIIEANTLDSESWQHTLANSRASQSESSVDSSPAPGPWSIQQKGRESEKEEISVWSLILDFVEGVYIAPKEEITDQEEREEQEEEEEEEILSLGSIKGGLIKSIVAVAGSDELAESLFEAPGRTGFLGRMKSFLSGGNVQEDREDLVICAVLSLGNLARSDARCASLLEPSSSILPSILPLMVSTTDIKIQHGLVGLLKNLAVCDQNKSILGEAGVIEQIIQMKCLQPERDTVSSVQGGAIGVLKNLAKNNLSNSLRILSPPSSTDEAALSSILAFNARSDDFSLQAESARVLVNVIRTLLSSPHTITSEPKPESKPDTNTSTDEVERVQIARGVLVEKKDEITKALIGLIKGGIGKKYEILCAEGVMALAMLAGSSEAIAKTIGAALLEPISSTSPRAESSSITDSSESSSTAPSAVASTSVSKNSATLLDELAVLLSLQPQPQSISSEAFTISPALKGNISSLLAISGRALSSDGYTKGDPREQFGKALERMAVENTPGGMADVKEKALKILRD
ncbi:Rho/Rac GTPase guanine nucleotide exchange factor smgGDS/Vimar [Phaffia rhodozyma]|uniref:Rho/Rac GTPase guanine nucleotide exchange factor smgGDS/Vimar n=1 Tax=Phaffia rhodozyma TaxID=264483 RepID=A0A0F7SF98_PHARH|nr:Rho/Rac GTPase guanine nucleotide exchange factor smgGDS/Vimar [Phaffia rhodozyma]